MKRTLFASWCMPVLVAFWVLPLSSALAEIVVFELHNDTNTTFDFDASTGSYTDTSGLTAVFTAVVAGSSGTLNATANSLGVNAVNGFIAGNPNDATDRLDESQGAESITITFSGPVSATLMEVGIVGFSGTDAGILEIGGVSTAIAAGSDTAIPVHNELVGNTLTVAYTPGSNGSGFGIETLTFNVVSVVPEPTSIAWVVMGGVMMMVRRRRH